MKTSQITTELPLPDDMTLRDYFAVKALEGIAGACLIGSGMVNDKARSHTVATIAYCLADAMLEVRQDI